MLLLRQGEPLLCSLMILIPNARRQTDNVELDSSRLAVDHDAGTMLTEKTFHPIEVKSGPKGHTRQGRDREGGRKGATRWMTTAMVKADGVEG